MADTDTLNVGMDSNMKREFVSFCEELGMSASSPMNVFDKTVIRNQEVPFAMTSRMTSATAPDRYRSLFPQSEAELFDMLASSAATPLDSCVSQEQGVRRIRERIGW